LDGNEWQLMMAGYLTKKIFKQNMTNKKAENMIEIWLKFGYEWWIMCRKTCFKKSRKPFFKLCNAGVVDSFF
jgi:hypothetical protein